MANSPLSSQRPLSKTEISTSLNRYDLARPLLITKQAWLVLTLPFRWMLRLVYVVAAILFTPFIVAYFVIPTQKDVAYRHVHPAEPVCQTNDEPWTVLAAINSKTAAAGGEGQDGWIDPSNNEIDAIGKDEIWKRRFRCSIQHHAIPVSDNPLPDVTLPIEYHLAFLEYRENGVPYSLAHEDGRSYSAAEMLALTGCRPPNPSGPPLPVSQLDVLLRHLEGKSNYVIVFAHGWRHDASIGDQNVADLSSPLTKS